MGLSETAAVAFPRLGSLPPAFLAFVLAAPAFASTEHPAWEHQMPSWARRNPQLLAGRSVDRIELRTSYAPGFVVLSILVAILGSACTIELLLRRTSNRGTWNVFLTVGAGWAFGSVSTFAMHFLGNSALTLRKPATAGQPNPPRLTLAYHPGWTVLSLVVSVVSMTVAFAVVGLDFNLLFHRKNDKHTRRRGTRPKSSTILGGGSDDGKKLQHKLKKGFSSSFASSREATQHSQVWQMLEGALAWTMSILGPTSRPSAAGYHGGATDRNKSATYRREEAEERTEQLRQEELDAGCSEPQPHQQPHQEQQPPMRPTVALDTGSPQRLPATATATVDITRSDEEKFLDHLNRSWYPYTPTYSNPVVNILTSSSASGSCSRPLAADPPSGAASISQPHPSSDFATWDAAITQFREPHLAADPSRVASPPAAAASPSMPGSTPVASRRTSTQGGGALARSIVKIDWRKSGMTWEEYDSHSQAGGEPLPWIPPEDSTAASGSSAQPSLGRTRSREEAEEFVEMGEPSGYPSRKTCVESTRLNDSDNLSADLPPALANRLTSGSEDDIDTEHWVWLNGVFKRLGLSAVTKAEIVKVVASGTVCGFGIAGMHYLGQKSITSIPFISYAPAIVVGSVIVASVVVIIALWAMFLVLRRELQHSLFKRACVACLLGSSTSIFHFTASLGTTYAVDPSKELPPSSRDTYTKKTIIALVSTLSVLASLGVLMSVLFAQRRLQTLKAGRKRTVLAMAIFDDATGRLLVSPDGVLPLTDIGGLNHVLDQNDKGLQSGRRLDHDSDQGSVSSSTLDIDLSTSHPAFVACLKSTWSWRQVGVVGSSASPGLVQSPSLHLPDSAMRGGRSSRADSDVSGALPITALLARPSGISFPSGSMGEASSSIARFVEAFTAAASHLAAEVFSPSAGGLQSLGVLYDRVLTSGFISFGVGNGEVDQVSRGQLLVLINRCKDHVEKVHLTRRGYIFAEPHSVARVMSTILATPLNDMTSFVSGLQEYSRAAFEPAVVSGSVYVGLLIVQALPFEGLKIIVDARLRHSLPLRRLGTIDDEGRVLINNEGASSDEVREPERPLAQSIEELGTKIASELGGKTLLTLMREASPPASSKDDGEPTSASISLLHQAIVDTVVPLMDHVPRESMNLVLRSLALVPSLITLPASSTVATSRPCYLIVLKAVLSSSDEFTALGPAWSLEPFRLFRAVNENLVQEAASRATDPTTLSAPPFTPIAVKRASKIQWGSMNLPPRDLPSPFPAAVVPAAVAAPPPSFAGFSFSHTSPSHPPPSTSVSPLFSPPSQFPIVTPARSSTPIEPLHQSASASSLSPSRRSSLRASLPPTVQFTHPMVDVLGPTTLLVGDDEGNGDGLSPQSAADRLPAIVAPYDPAWIERLLRDSWE